MADFKCIYFDGSNGWRNGGMYSTEILHDEDGIRYITITHENDSDEQWTTTYYDSDGEGIFTDPESEGDEMYIEVDE